jgi:peptide deformylase
MSLKLRIVPDPVLRKVAQKVPSMDKDTSRFMHAMLETMYENRGIGLAAPQVGELRRVIVMDVADEQSPDKAILMANPEITWKSEDTFTYKEGCLSIPGQFAEVTRPKKVRVAYIDEKGKPQELEAEDLLSSCVQHEIDHLNGVLFVDYLSKMRRDMMLKRVEKERKLAEAEAAEKGDKVF